MKLKKMLKFKRERAETESSATPLLQNCQLSDASGVITMDIGIDILQEVCQSPAGETIELTGVTRPSEKNYPQAGNGVNLSIKRTKDLASLSLQVSALSSAFHQITDTLWRCAVHSVSKCTDDDAVLEKSFSEPVTMESSSQDATYSTSDHDNKFTQIRKPSKVWFSDINDTSSQDSLSKSGLIRSHETTSKNDLKAGAVSSSQLRKFSEDKFSNILRSIQDRLQDSVDEYDSDFGALGVGSSSSDYESKLPKVSVKTVQELHDKAKLEMVSEKKDEESENETKSSTVSRIECEISDSESKLPTVSVQNVEEFDNEQNKSPTVPENHIEGSNIPSTPEISSNLLPTELSCDITVNIQLENTPVSENEETFSDEEAMLFSDCEEQEENPEGKTKKSLRSKEKVELYKLNKELVAQLRGNDGTSDDIKQECIICRAKFKSSWPMPRHIMSFHLMSLEDYKELLTCSSEDRQQHLSNIRSSGIPEKPSYNPKMGGSLPCDYCGEVLVGILAMRYHLRMNHHNESDLKDKMDIYREKYKVLMTRNRRKYSAKQYQTKTEYPCRHCGLVLTFACSRSRHELYTCIQNPNRQKRYHCNSCDRTCSSHAELLSHQKEHRETNYRHECSQCGKVTRTKTGMYQHTLKEHSGKEPRYQCQVCNKQFYRNDKYQRHLHVHKDDRSFQCEICGKQFKTHEAVQKHQHSIHNNQYPYRCPTCGHGVQKKQYLKTHRCDRVRRIQNPGAVEAPNEGEDTVAEKVNPKPKAKKTPKVPKLKVEKEKAPKAPKKKRRKKSIDQNLKQVEVAAEDVKHEETTSKRDVAELGHDVADVKHDIADAAEIAVTQAVKQEMNTEKQTIKGVTDHATIHIFADLSKHRIADISKQLGTRITGVTNVQKPRAPEIRKPIMTRKSRQAVSSVPKSRRTDVRRPNARNPRSRHPYTNITDISKNLFPSDDASKLKLDNDARETMEILKEQGILISDEAVALFNHTPDQQSDVLPVNPMNSSASGITYPLCLQPFASENNVPVNSQALDSHIAHVLQMHNSQALEMQNSQVLNTPHSQVLDTHLHALQAESSNSQVFDTQTSRVFDTQTSRELDSYTIQPPSASNDFCSFMYPPQQLNLNLDPSVSTFGGTNPIEDLSPLNNVSSTLLTPLNHVDPSTLLLNSIYHESDDKLAMDTDQDNGMISPKLMSPFLM